MRGLRFKKYSRRQTYGSKFFRSYMPVFGGRSSFLRVLECGRLYSWQLEACRRAIRKVTGKKVHLWLRSPAVVPMAEFPKEGNVRMGHGKHKQALRVLGVRAGYILFEIFGVDSESVARRALAAGVSKLPLRAEGVVSGSDFCWK